MSLWVIHPLNKLSCLLIFPSTPWPMTICTFLIYFLYCFFPFFFPYPISFSHLSLSFLFLILYIFGYLPGFTEEVPFLLFSLLEEFTGCLTLHWNFLLRYSKLVKLQWKPHFIYLFFFSLEQREVYCKAKQRKWVAWAQKPWTLKPYFYFFVSNWAF